MRLLIFLFLLFFSFGCLTYDDCIDPSLPREEKINCFQYMAFKTGQENNCDNPYINNLTQNYTQRSEYLTCIHKLASGMAYNNLYNSTYVENICKIIRDDPLVANPSLYVQCLMDVAVAYDNKTLCTTFDDISEYKIICERNIEWAISPKEPETCRLPIAIILLTAVIGFLKYKK